MQSLEALITSLKITTHTVALSNWRDALLVEKAAELKALSDERDAIQTEFAAYKASAEGALTAAAEAIQNPDLNDTATVQAIAEIVTEVGKPVKQREREAIEKQIAELQSKLK